MKASFRFINLLMALALAIGAVVTAAPQPVQADNTAQTLPFSQDWTNIGLITTNDDWSGVPGIMGYRGDGLTAANDVDPQTVLGDGTLVVCQSYFDG
ncbi:MAG: hypothetical protein KA928_00270 [Longilinea sp.]|nr:hypothetical protein [Longilinea sp.]